MSNNRKYKLVWDTGTEAPANAVLFENEDVIVVTYTHPTHDEEYALSFIKEIGTNKFYPAGTAYYVDSNKPCAFVSLVMEESRKVPLESRVDFTKPIELFYPEEAKDPSIESGGVYPCEYVGAVHECQRNFPSWFVCRDLTPVLIINGEPMWTEECNLFLVRGDGKTDVFGATVRNVVTKTVSSFLPLKKGRLYRTSYGKIGTAIEEEDYLNIAGWHFNQVSGVNLYDGDHTIVEESSEDIRVRDGKIELRFADGNWYVI